MAVYYRPLAGIPPWVRELADIVGVDQAINVLRARQTTATSLSDATDATALGNMASALQSSGAFTSQHAASARNTFMVIRKA